ncbi:MAG: copper-translocating P-type ATPase [bacterium]|nr:copper-translocating P-type ATPase [bacterium]
MKTKKKKDIKLSEHTDKHQGKARSGKGLFIGNKNRLPRHHAEAKDGPHNHHGNDLKKRFFISLALTVPVLLFSQVVPEWFNLPPLFSFPGQGYLVWALSSLLFFYGGFPFLKGFVREMRSKRPGMMTLITMAITAAYLYSSSIVFGLKGMDLFWELAALIDIMLLGHWIETRSVRNALQSLEEIARLLPYQAHKLLADDKITDLPLDQLTLYDVLLVKAGEKVPADSVIMKGETSVDESMLTGESVPVQKKAGSEVIGGSLNLDNPITVHIRKLGKDSFIQNLIRLVQEAQAGKSKLQGLADRTAFWLTLLSIGLGIITFILWRTGMDRSVAFSLERAVTVIVIACPHALGLAIPLVVAVSTTLAARKGFIIKNRAAFEKGHTLQAVLFDKTGTLTQGKFGVTDVMSFRKGLNEAELLKYAASIESHSSHPIAQGICSASREIYPVTEFKSLPGKGVEGKVNNKNIRVVNLAYLKKNNIKTSGLGIDKLFHLGKTVVFVIIDGELKGMIACADMIRPESKQAVACLKKMGIRSIMVTGDNKEIAQWVSDIIGIEEYYSEMLPADKVKKVRELKARYTSVAMTGDGINDAPALAQADLGIAVGAGTDIARETADLILVRSNPLDILNVIRLARSTYTKMIQNLLWAYGYNMIAIPLAMGLLYPAGILLHPGLAALFMSLSTIIVALNARSLNLPD